MFYGKVFCIRLQALGLKPNTEYLNLKCFCLPLPEIYSSLPLAPADERTGKAKLTHGQCIDQSGTLWYLRIIFRNVVISSNKKKKETIERTRSKKYKDALP